MSDSNFGDNLNRLRKLKGLTQTQLADKCGIYGMQISQYERGTYPYVATLKLLCEALNVTATELLGF